MLEFLLNVIVSSMNRKLLIGCGCDNILDNPYQSFLFTWLFCLSGRLSIDGRGWWLLVQTSRLGTFLQIWTCFIPSCKVGLNVLFPLDSKGTSHFASIYWLCAMLENLVAIWIILCIVSQRFSLQVVHRHLSSVSIKDEGSWGSREWEATINGNRHLRLRMATVTGLTGYYRIRGVSCPQYLLALRF